jgi:hypothetical protein
MLNVSSGSGLFGRLFSDSGRDWAHVGAGSGKSMTDLTLAYLQFD